MLRKGLVGGILVVLLISSLSFAQPQGVPVDIPGTDVNFFLYRYETDSPPYSQIEDIWSSLSAVFLEWVENGQDPYELTAEDVNIRHSDQGLPAIYIKDVHIVTVDEYHAKLNQATPEQLAKMWADNLKKGVEAFVKVNVLKE